MLDVLQRFLELRAWLSHLDEAEVEHLHEVVLQAHATDVDVGRLDVAAHEPSGMRIGEGMSRLPQQVDHSVSGHWAELTHQRVQVAAREQLHHVVEGALVGDPVVRTPGSCGES